MSSVGTAAPPAECEASEIAANLLPNGLAVIGSEAFIVNGKAPHAARVSLGAARNRAELMRALQILTTTLKQPASQDHFLRGFSADR